MKKRKFEKLPFVGRISSSLSSSSFDGSEMKTKGIQCRPLKHNMWIVEALSLFDSVALQLFILCKQVM